MDGRGEITELEVPALRPAQCHAPTRSQEGAAAGLSTAQKVALATAIITTIGAIAVAVVNIIPSLHGAPTAVQAGSPK